MVWFFGGVSFLKSGPFSGWFGDINGLEDQFSPVGTFFSAIASAGAVWAIILQSDLLERQMFEANFYQLLELHKCNRDNVYAQKKCTDSRNERKVAAHNLPCVELHTNHEFKYVTGVQAFEVLYEKLTAIIAYTYGTPDEGNKQYLDKATTSAIISIAFETKGDKEARFKGIYDVFSESVSNCLDHYFRNFYHIIKHIDEEVTKPELRKKYFGILRAQLSPYEYALFYYNGLASDDRDNGRKRSKIKRLIEENGLLQNIERGLLSDEEEAGKYAAGAFDVPSKKKKWYSPSQDG
jgi:hypothetical protein